MVLELVQGGRGEWETLGRPPSEPSQQPRRSAGEAGTCPVLGGLWDIRSPDPPGDSSGLFFLDKQGPQHPLPGQFLVTL